ncbi:hypothetical protein CYMTET_46478 [Cymbomonas tetramitiformis]|uniref:Protein kinase domain-containing protein n=1 Tax=Cymbomonas tetramitiformis TaxID=36881 RepID=A0AAE0BW65_9CHLO|nr:hypothetical protein CYMTET_46478 [Cymbomonas tetramitiformis]
MNRARTTPHLVTRQLQLEKCSIKLKNVQIKKLLATKRVCKPVALLESSLGSIMAIPADAGTFFSQMSTVFAEHPQASSTISTMFLALSAVYGLHIAAQLVDLAVSAQQRKAQERQFDPDDFRVLHKLGGGNYGKVFKARMLSTGQCVVIKKLADNEDGRLCGDTELHVNWRVMQRAGGAGCKCAAFLGEVRGRRASSGQPWWKSNKGLEAGRYLVWQYEGSNTLADVIANPTFPNNILDNQWIAVDSKRENTIRMPVEELTGSISKDHQAIRLIMFQLLQALESLHAKGIVHRDVKPDNLLITPDRGLLAIDFGACADLRMGVNYEPGQAFLDYLYAAPEKYCLPKWVPGLPKGLIHQGSPAALLMSPFVWMHNPDRFDMYAAGLILMQMSVPSLRKPEKLWRFRCDLKKNGHDLEAWRAASGLPDSTFHILDADGCAGWLLASALLRPQVSSRGRVLSHLTAGRQGERPSASLALSHKFFRSAQAEPADFGPLGSSSTAASPLTSLQPNVEGDHEDTGCVEFEGTNVNGSVPTGEEGSSVAAAVEGAPAMRESAPLMPTEAVAQPSTTLETATLISDSALIPNLSVKELKAQCKLRRIAQSGNKTQSCKRNWSPAYLSILLLLSLPHQ